MLKSVLIPLFFVSLMMTSCTSFLDFQSAKTLGKGKNELTVAATSANFQNEANQSNPFVAPSVEFRRGMTEKFDLGLHSQPFSTIGINGKYQFVGDQKKKLAFAGMFELGFDYSVGDELTYGDVRGYDGFFELNSAMDSVPLNYQEIRGELGLIGSYHIGKELAVTSSIKGIAYPGLTQSTYTWVNTYGIEVGKKTKFSFNAGYNLVWTSTATDAGFVFGRWQYGIGVKKPINFKTKKEEPKTLQ